MNTIFLIDDDIDDVELFREALEEVDPSVSFLFSHDGREAIRDLTEHKIVVPDLIFLDISMPSIDGLQCLGILRKTENMKQVPVIMYTTSSQEREIALAGDLGANGFITKPNDFKLLKKILALILDTPLEKLSETLRKIRKGE